MRRTIRPDLEGLERRALLSVVPSTTPGLVDKLTAVVHKTTFGVQVVATLTLTNESTQNLTVDDGPSIDGFQAIQAGQVDWVSNGGINPDFITLDVLKPGQSLTLKATWDGHLNEVNPFGESVEGPALSGTFTISNELDRGSATATVTIPKSWISGRGQPPIQSPTPPAQHRG